MHFKQERFRCVIPGIWTNESYNYPICTSEVSNATSLGFDKIMTFQSAKTFWLSSKTMEPLLIMPPLGLYKNDSGCIKRCSRFEYSLQEETFAPNYDRDVTTYVYEDYYYKLSNVIGDNVIFCNKEEFHSN